MMKEKKDIIATCLNVVKENKYTVILFVSLFLLGLAMHEAFNAKKVVFAFLNMSFIYVILELFSFFKYKVIQLVSVIVFTIIITADTTFLLLYGQPLSYSILASIFETTKGEMVSMSKMLIFPVIIIFFILFFLFYKSSGEMKKRKKIYPAISVLWLILGLIVFPVTWDMRVSNKTVSIVFDSLKESSGFYWAKLISSRNPLVFSDIVNINLYFEEMKVLRDFAYFDKTLPEGVEKKSDSTFVKPQKIVFVIGESLYRKHMSLYGYGIKTSPFMDSLNIHSSQLAFYDNVISPACTTREALRICLTFASPVNNKPFLEKKSLINLANDAEYETFWISGQAEHGIHETYIGMLASNTTHAIYDEKKERDDFNLVPLISTNLRKDEKQFFFIHTNGSHQSYEDKYDEEDTKALGSEGATIDYDKSVHHTDRLIAQIYDILINSGDDFLLCFFSDHGELLGYGHGMVDKGKSQFEIPLVFISNMYDREKLSPIADRYYNKDINQMSISSLIYIMGEIMGYSVSPDVVEKAVEEGKYIFQANAPLRMLSEIVD